MEIFWVIIVLQAIFCGFLSMNLAEHKGHSSGAWFASGFFFGIFGLIAAAGLPTKTAPPSMSGLQKKCPDCAESIRREALVCKFCGRKFSKEQVVAELIDTLSDKSMSIQLQALDALRTTKDGSVASHLLKLIETLTIANQVDPNVQLLNRSIQVLSEVGSPSISPDLVSILKKTGSMMKASKIIEILGSFRDPASIPAIVACLKTQELRDVAARSLHNFGEAALPHLDQVIKEGKRAERKLAEQIIEKIKPSPRK